MDVSTGVPKRPLLELDPDYEDGHASEAKRRCMVEDSGQGHAQQRVLEMVARDLDAALAQKESEVLQLQEKTQTCQRALHLLRFGITSVYYKNFLSADDSARNMEGQSALHPAVLRLVKFCAPGNGPKTRGVRTRLPSEGPIGKEAGDESSFQGDATKKYLEQRGKQEENEDGERVGDSSWSKIIQEDNTEKKQEPVQSKVPRYVPPLLPEPPAVCAASVRMERHRIKRRLVVGNVSKWLPEDLREDAASHKWMLYVRGPKDSPDISEFVSKVRYFLHPSYGPHDIVDVVHPFYLARRGWGEFPVRVQVHFVIPGNRPIDIIHNLKLDRSYSGLQTLGGETVVDVWLKNMTSNQKVEQSDVPSGQGDILKVQGELGEKQEENLEEKKNDKGPLSLEQGNSKDHIKETDGKLEIPIDDVQKPNKANDIASNRFVLHILPDHDYLGPDTFKIKCTSCADYPYLENDILSKEKIDHEGTCNGGTLLETVQQEAVTKGISGSHNALLNEDLPSVVHCVDSKGNLHLISLQKPTLTGKCDSKGVKLTHSPGAQIQHSSCSDVSNSGTGGKVVKNMILQKNATAVSLPTVLAGQSLLKKSCLGSPSLTPLSITNGRMSPVELNGRKMTFEKSYLDPIKMDTKLEPENLLKETCKMVSKISDNGQVVTWLLQLLPLVDDRVNSDIEFKKQNPYCASNLDAFLAWSSGKRHCAERLRAKAAHSILESVNPLRFAKWSVRHIMTWSRMHSLTPLPSKEHDEQIDQKCLPDINSSIKTTVTEPSEVRDWLESVAEASKTAEEVEDVNVVDLSPSIIELGAKSSNHVTGTPNCVTLMHKNNDSCEFIHKTTEQLDVRLAPEMLCPGILYPAAEDLLFTACKSLCQDLLRRGAYEAWKRCKQLPKEITLIDVQNALLMRPEFDIFTNAGLGVQEYDAS